MKHDGILKEYYKSNHKYRCLSTTLPPKEMEFYKVINKLFDVGFEINRTIEMKITNTEIEFKQLTC
jgi:hypothetical protein